MERDTELDNVIIENKPTTTRHGSLANRLLPTLLAGVIAVADGNHTDDEYNASDRDQDGTGNLQ